MFDVLPINRVKGNVFFAAPHPIAKYSWAATAKRPIRTRLSVYLSLHTSAGYALVCRFFKRYICDITQFSAYCSPINLFRKHNSTRSLSIATTALVAAIANRWKIVGQCKSKSFPLSHFPQDYDTVAKNQWRPPSLDDHISAGSWHILNCY